MAFLHSLDQRLHSIAGVGIEQLVEASDRPGKLARGDQQIGALVLSRHVRTAAGKIKP